MLDFSGITKQESSLIMKRCWLIQLAIGLVCAGLGFLMCPTIASSSALAGGILWGLLDNGVILGSTVVGFGLSPEASRRLLVKCFICRLATGVIFIFVMLGIKLRVLEAFIGFILLHIFLIINLYLFTKNINNKITKL